MLNYLVISGVRLEARMKVSVFKQLIKFNMYVKLIKFNITYYVKLEIGAVLSGELVC